MGGSWRKLAKADPFRGFSTSCPAAGSFAILFGSGVPGVERSEPQESSVRPLGARSARPQPPPFAAWRPNMSLSNESMLAWCRTLLNVDPAAPRKSLEQYLAAIPRLSSLADVPSGTPVLVRGDVDAKPGAKIGEGDERLRSMVDTLKFGVDRGWKQVIFGHIGRKPEGSLKDVAARIGELLGQKVALVG